MSFFSDHVSLEGLFRLCQVVAWIAGALALLALLGKDVTQRMIADRQAKALAEARKQQAASEVKLERAITDLEKREGAVAGEANAQWHGRRVRMQCLIAELGSDPPKEIAIRVLYQNDPRNVDKAFARKIWLSLSLAGWPLADSSEQPWKDAPVDIVASIITASSTTGLFISPRIRNKDNAEGSAEDKLVTALSKCGARFEAIRASSTDTIFLIVGPVPSPTPTR